LKFVADESVDKPIVDHIRNCGYKVLYIEEESPGIADEAVLEKANRQESFLITCDRDFGELVYRQRLISNGIILLRLSGLTTRKKY